MKQKSAAAKPARKVNIPGNAKLWGGRFAESTSALVEQFSESVSFDQRLYRQDIRGSQAHAKMLGKVGVLTKKDVTAIVKGLVALVLLLADNRPPAAIDTGEIRARLDALGLSKHLSSNRTQGLASMIARIGELAATSAA